MNNASWFNRRHGDVDCGPERYACAGESGEMAVAADMKYNNAANQG